jgi:biotin transport system permease protein
MNLFGLYVPGDSWLHRLHAGWKYFLLLALTLPVLVIAEPGPSIAAMLVAMVLLITAKIDIRSAWTLPVGFWVVAAMLAGYQVLTGHLDLAAAVAANLITAVYASRLLTLTTPGSVLIDSLVAGLRPVRRLGVNPELIGLAIAIMLRSIPMLFDSFGEVRQAAQARGRERNLFALVTPVVVRAVGHAQATGAALAARGLGET